MGVFPLYLLTLVSGGICPGYGKSAAGADSSLSVFSFVGYILGALLRRELAGVSSAFVYCPLPFFFFCFF